MLIEFICARNYRYIGHPLLFQSCKKLHVTTWTSFWEFPWWSQSFLWKKKKWYSQNILCIYLKFSQFKNLVLIMYNVAVPLLLTKGMTLESNIIYFPFMNQCCHFPYKTTINIAIMFICTINSKCNDIYMDFTSAFFFLPFTSRWGNRTKPLLFYRHKLIN